MYQAAAHELSFVCFSTNFYTLNIHDKYSLINDGNKYLIYNVEVTTILPKNGA